MSFELVMFLSALTMCISALLARRFCESGSFFYLLDHPNDRSLHSRPTPRTGGIAILAAALVGGAGVLFFTGTNGIQIGWLLTGVVIVAIVSYVDDRRGLAPGFRIVAHFIAAVVLVCGEFFAPGAWPGGTGALPVTAIVAISVLYIVWMLNLYNFMDGMDGFCGGMTVIGFTVFAILGYWAGESLFVGLCLILVAATGGFLIFNFPPARIFMGDTGSSTLGLFVAGFSLWGTRDGIFPFWVTLLVFSPFIVDATVTLIRRVVRGEKVWQAHKTHYYQRLVQLGWGHRRTALLEYVLMVACGVSAVFGARAVSSVQWIIIGFWVIAYVVMATAIHRLENQYKR